jgi:NAD(P)H-hydrate epimerase
MKNEDHTGTEKRQKAQQDMRTIAMTELPQLTTAQMIEVDRLMMEEWHISLIQMMENAGRNTAELAKQLSGGRLTGKRIIILCGTGNNGGGGIAASRHLHNWDTEVQAVLVGSPQKLKAIPAKQWQILQKMGLILPEARACVGEL